MGVSKGVFPDLEGNRTMVLIESQWDGKKQYQDAGSKSLMMLPTDMALVKDREFKKHVERFAKDDQAFYREFSDVIVKLFELGVPFTSKEDDRITLKKSF